MDDIDKLMRKYGAEKLMSSILQRLNYPAYFQNSLRKGAPKHDLSQLWGLRDVFHHFQAKFPNEKQDFIADRMLLLLGEYRSWLRNPDLYQPELSLNKDLFDKISWLGNHGKRKITSKTIVNKLVALKKEDKKYARKFVDDVFGKQDFSIHPPGWMDGDDLNDY